MSWQLIIIKVKNQTGMYWLDFLNMLVLKYIFVINVYVSASSTVPLPLFGSGFCLH